ncbi:MAG: beta-galactosidase [Lentisphaerota bacterium]
MTYTSNMLTSRKHLLAGLLAGSLALAVTAWGGGNSIEIRNGYFWDPMATNYWVPHGISYQVWNPPVFATQTFAQLDYDLNEMKKMYVNSLRVEFTWGEVEQTEGAYNFTNTDYLVSRAEEMGLKLFVLIGYQYPPGWVSANYPDRMARHYDTTITNYGQSAILNYNHPAAQSTYSNYIRAVCNRYKDSKAIAGWIVGNEFAFYDLWENYDPKRFVGFDTNYSALAYRAWLTNQYTTIGALNAAWATAYPGFSSVPMALTFPPNREDQLAIQQSGYNDLIKWRKQVIGDFLAKGAAAAKSADTNHLVTYAMVGGIFNGGDQNNSCEDAPTIIARCQAAGAPLDFWTINNYPWTLTGSEMRSGDFGISKYRDTINIPLLLSETGLSDTDNLFVETSSRQAGALASTIWEALMSGAIGAHIFHWSDRDEFPSWQIRERGFGIVRQSRLVKDPVYYNIVDMFRRMTEMDIASLLGRSTDPTNQILLYWPDDADLGWDRANQENAMVWGAFKRMGFQIGIMDGPGFEQREWTNARALFLSRNFQMKTNHLDVIETEIIATGIHVHANADLPGRFGPHHEVNPNWVSRMSSIFGLNVSSAVPGLDTGSKALGGYPADYSNMNATVQQNLGPLNTTDAMRHFGTWKIWHGVTAASGTTILTQTGCNGSKPAMPGLQVKDHGAGKGKAAVNTFAMGDIIHFFGDGNPNELGWIVRSDLLEAIYTNYFGLTPDITVSGSRYVMMDRRICSNNSQIVSLLNMSAAPATVTLSAPSVMSGKKIENLTRGGLVTNASSGPVTVDLAADEMVWLYVYDSTGGADTSLVNAHPQKLWIEDAPLCVWPNGQNKLVQVRYDTQGSNLNLKVAFESAAGTGTVYGLTTTNPAAGSGMVTVAVPVPEADLGDARYISHNAGGVYRFRAWLETLGGTPVSETKVPVRLLWGARPVSLPSSLLPSTPYAITIQWEDIPSFLPDQLPTPLNRADVWPYEHNDTTEKYYVHLDLLNSNGVSVVSTTILTSAGTFSNRFTATTPSALTNPPYAWKARLVSDLWGDNHDVVDSFEDRGQGDNPALFGPWTDFAYDQNGGIQRWAQGVDSQASEGTQSVFLIVNNANPGGWSGFGLSRDYSRTWALPPPTERTNIWFAFDFKETNIVAGTLTMKVEDSGTPHAGAIEYTTPYTGGWQTISNKLSSFVVSAYPGTFDSNNVKRLTILLQTDTRTGVYFSHFDNVRFVGTTSEWMGGVTSGDLHASFEDLTQGEWVTPAPWTAPASYPDGGSQQWVTHGIDGHASDGVNGHFFIFTSHTNVGGYSGIYELYTFPSEPKWTGALSSVRFSLDFYETNGASCDLELQIKSASGQSVCSRPYNHTPGGWDTVSASLDQFTGTVDTAHLTTLGFVVKMNTRSAEYACHLDNIRFSGTTSSSITPVTNGLYFSINDTPPGADTDGDGILDVYETDTGIWNGPTDTGTDPLNPDSDGDLQRDGDEVIAGTNPNVQSDVFAADDMRSASSSGMSIAWYAHTNRVYSVHYFDGSLLSGGPFNPLGNYTNITVPANGMTNVIDATINGATQRFYRVNVRME